MRGAMVIRLFAVGLCAAAIVAMTLAPVDAVAQTRQKHYSYGKREGSRPRARVVVGPRSFLDAGTEVKPGDRKFTDYAFPPGFQGSSGYVTNIGGKVGWDRSPFMQPFQLPGFGAW
jgi:hypothetical protein